MALIYSVGHSVRSGEDFLGLLREYRIEQLVDVRRFPRSRRHPQFSRDRLGPALLRGGITYFHLGEELGGFREEGYERYRATPAFERGLRALELAAAERLTAFMCAEKLPFTCHRRFIAESLAERGWRVLHVLDRGQVWDPELALLPP